MNVAKAKSVKQPISGDVMERFFKCPKGHTLPHRNKKGRCCPFDCCEAKGGAWSVVRQAERAVTTESSAYAEETMKLSEMKERMRAWNEAHPIQELPPPPKGTHSVQEYMKKRLEQVAPLLLEMKIRKALLDPTHAGLAQADDMLDRQGTTRNPQQSAPMQGPVLIVNFNPAKDSPYEAQKRDPAIAAGATVDGQFKAIGDGTSGEKHENTGGERSESDQVVE